ncbi:MAG: F0F1 ATP synthase subunit alpha, partial [Pseudomonadota bacterium]
MLETIVAQATQAVATALGDHRPRVVKGEIGRLLGVEQGIARVSGLPGAKAMEVVRFDNGTMGMVFNLDVDELGTV